MNLPITNQYNCISIVGMCKNAGKTTVLNALISGARGVLGITSIGRDGEQTDLVTATPKPKIFVPSGTLIATARSLFPLCTVSKEILSCSGVFSALGEIIIFRAKSYGSVQIGGASTTLQMEKVINLLCSFGATKVLIDGAISRKVFSTLPSCDATILCSGAAYSPDLDKTVEDTALVSEIFLLPKANLPQAVGDYLVTADETICLNAKGEVLPKENAKLPPQTQYVYVSGALTDSIFASLASLTALKGKTIVTNTSGQILLSLDNYQKITAFGVHFAVLYPQNLIAVTVNPVSPYGYNYDAEQFAQKMRAKCKVSVFNVNSRN